MSASSGSASASGPTADELLKNLLDSVTPTASSTSGDGSATSKVTGTTSTTTAPAPQPVATTVAPTPSATDQSVSSTVDTQSSSSKGGSGAGLSVGLGIGAVLLVAFVVLYFRQRKKRRYKAPGHDHELGTPQLSIELPHPPPLNGDRKPQDDDRASVFTSVQYGGESVFNAAGEVSPGFHAGMRPAPSQSRASNNPQTGPVSTTFRMDGSSAFNPSIANPVPDSSKTNKLTHVVSGRVPAFDNPRASPVPVLTEGGGSLPRDTSASTSSLNSLHDSTCGDFFKHGDGLGERIRAKSRTKHPSMVLEEDEESSSRSNQPSVGSRITASMTAVADPTPKTAYAAPVTPLTAPPPPPPVPATRRAPPPPPPAAAFVKPPPIATSNSQTYRPSTTESEIRFQRLSTMSSDSIGSMKRASTSSVESANPRAGSMIEINEIVGGEGSQRAKEIEI